jgi:D-glycero-D-manno-heptose 1,7-bisphosphate phosphatase
VITSDGCWADFRIARSAAAGRPCLFLDRDGVLIEDVGYPHRPEDIAIVPEAVALVRAAGAAGYVTGIVTNQSGIARGLFGWPAFAVVQDMIDDAVQANGGQFGFVLACPYLPQADMPRYRRADHPWRKPAPGMLRAAADRLGLDLARSVMVGDRITDMEAAAAAGVRHRWLMPDGRGAVPPASDWAIVDRAGVVAAFEELARAIAR